MTQNPDSLKENLEQLHHQLQTAQRVDPQTRQLLEETLGDIRRILEQEPAQAEDEEKSIVDRLNDAALRFEESHPTLANTIGRLADLLAQMGI